MLTAVVLSRLSGGVEGKDGFPVPLFNCDRHGAVLMRQKDSEGSDCGIFQAKETVMLNSTDFCSD